MKKGIVLKLAMFVAAFAISTFAPSMTAAAASYDDEFVALINQKRAANGLQPVSLNSTLDNAAETRAEVLTEKFSYQRPDGRREFTVLDDNNIADNFVGVPALPRSVFCSPASSGRSRQAAAAPASGTGPD